MDNNKDLPFMKKSIRVKNDFPMQPGDEDSTGKKLVLIIDDDIYMVKTLRNILSVEGYNVITASSGGDGIRKLFALYPDIILCDIAMNRIDGYDVLNIAKASPVTKAIPFIFITGKVSPGEEIRAIKAGADGFIKKPFAYGELINSLKEVSNKDYRAKRHAHAKAPATCTVSINQ